MAAPGAASTAERAVDLSPHSAYLTAHARADTSARTLFGCADLGPTDAMGDSLTVERWTLTPLVLVRIQVPQPSNSTRPVSDLAGFSLSETAPKWLATRHNTNCGFTTGYNRA